MRVDRMLLAVKSTTVRFKSALSPPTFILPLLLVTVARITFLRSSAQDCKGPTYRWNVMSHMTQIAALFRPIRLSVTESYSRLLKQGNAYRMDRLTGRLFGCLRGLRCH